MGLLKRRQSQKSYAGQALSSEVPMPDRPPCVAGTFYSADPTTLRTSIFEYLHPTPALREKTPETTCEKGFENGPEHGPEQGPEQEPKAPHMLILPHAGHIFCGQVIGAVLSRVRLPNTIILLCPNHTGQGHPLAVWPDGQWHTPLGAVPVDSECASALIHSTINAGDAGFTADISAHKREHSLEVILPFLQCHSPHSRIVPICVASHDPYDLERAGHALREVLNARALVGHNSTIIVSSDMNHFDSQQETVRKDGLALAHLLALQPDALLRTVIHNNISMCGVLPAVLAMHALNAEANPKANLVHYTTSAAVTQDTNKVVGYCGIIVN